MTIATIGRLMKNFDIAVTFRWKRFGIDHACPAGPSALLDDDALAWLDAVVNDPLVADGFAELHGPDAHLVVAVDHRHWCVPCRSMTACCGTSSAPWCDVDGGAHPAVLAGPQDIAGIREQPRDPDGAGSDVHLAVGEVQTCPCADRWSRRRESTRVRRRARACLALLRQWESGG